MRPILFQVRGIPVYSYTTFLYLGLLLGITVGHQLAPRFGVDAFRFWWVAVLMVPFGIAGGRALHVALNWRTYRGDLRRLFAFQEGGGSSLGALPAFVCISIPMLWLADLPVARFYDVMTYGLLCLMAVVRIGCGLSGCCCGRETASSFGVWMTNHRGERARRVPMQALESLGALVILGLLWAFGDLLTVPGTTFLTGLLLYGSFRFAFDPLREEVAFRPRPWGLTEHQWVALACVVAAGAGLLWIH